jgi:hypothetical protein
MLRLSPAECQSLRKICERSCLMSELPDDHQEKFINYGLAQREAMILRITPRGQLELLSSAFSNQPLRRYRFHRYMSMRDLLPFRRKSA